MKDFPEFMRNEKDRIGIQRMVIYLSMTFLLTWILWIIYFVYSNSIFRIIGSFMPSVMSIFFNSFMSSFNAYSATFYAVRLLVLIFIIVDMVRNPLKS